MRILHTIHSLNPAGGGPVEFIRQLIPLYNRDGHQLVVASMDDPDSQFVKEFPAAVVACGPSTPGYGFNPRYASWLEKERTQLDAVIVHGLWQYPGFASRRVLRSTATPYMLFPHGMLDPWFEHAYPFKHLKKSIYWAFAEHKVVRDACAVLFTAEQERANAQRSFAPYECNEIVVGLGCAQAAGNAVQQKANFLGRFPHLQDKEIILFLGRIHEKKGCDLLLQAFAEIALKQSNLHLVVVGPDTGSYAVKLKNAVPADCAGRITWTGMLVDDLKWGAIHAAAALILPSHQENFGIVVAEALSCGTPVLISNQVNIWQEVVDEHAGLADVDDLSGTKRLLQGWCNFSAFEKQNMQIAARRCFEKYFEIESAYGRINSIIENAGKVVTDMKSFN